MSEKNILPTGEQLFTKILLDNHATITRLTALLEKQMFYMEMIFTKPIDPNIPFTATGGSIQPPTTTTETNPTAEKEPVTDNESVTEEDKTIRTED